MPSVRLGDCLHLRQEVVHPRDNPAGEATFVGLEHIEGGTGLRVGSVQLEMASLTGRKPQFKKGDIVYGYLRPYLNKVWVAEFDGLCSVDQYVYSVIPLLPIRRSLHGSCEARFTWACAPIKTTPGQLPRICTEEVASVQINLPPCSEQKKVAAYLRSHMEAIRKARAGLED